MRRAHFLPYVFRLPAGQGRERPGRGYEKIFAVTSPRVPARPPLASEIKFPPCRHARPPPFFLSSFFSTFHWLAQATGLRWLARSQNRETVASVGTSIAAAIWPHLPTTRSNKQFNLVRTQLLQMPQDDGVFTANHISPFRSPLHGPVDRKLNVGSEMKSPWQGTLRHLGGARVRLGTCIRGALASNIGTSQKPNCHRRNREASGLKGNRTAVSGTLPYLYLSSVSLGFPS